MENGFGLMKTDKIINLSMRINSHELLFVWYRRAKSERFSEDVTIETHFERQN